MSKPIQKLKSGSVSVAVWKNDNDKLSFTFQHSYKIKETQEWKNTDFIPEYAMPNLLAVIMAVTNKAVLKPYVPKPSPTYTQEPTIPQASPQPTTYVNKPVDNDPNDPNGLPF